MHELWPSKKAIPIYKKIRVFVASVVFVLLASGAIARLGDSEAEIEKEYGHSVGKIENDPVLGSLLVFHYRQYEVRVIFVDGESQSEYYIHRDGRVPLTEAEIDFLLQLNSSGRTWRKSPELPLWRLGDSEAFAIYRSDDTSGLGICTAKFFEWQKERQTQRP